MVRVKRTSLGIDADRRNREQLARAGGQLKLRRVRKRKTQAQTADEAGVSRFMVGRMERGLGGGATMDAWQRVALAVDSPLVISLQRDLGGDTRDAAHLAIQELVLRAGRRGGHLGSFELATRPMEPSRSADVGLRNDRRRRLIVVECWNAFGDVGASARSSTRKLAEARDLSVAVWGDGSASVGLVWVVRASRRNRALVARYPELFASRFPGSSRAWLRAITEGTEPPAEPGLIWCDVHATRLFAWRKPA